MEKERKTPSEALEEYYKQNRGVLKVFLGYAPGVGKTFSMLNEANRRLKRGQDVVIGYLEDHGREETIEQVGNLSFIPKQKIDYKGRTLEEMDVDAIISRKPELVIVDELAHTNVPGSKHKKRYEDVLEILNHGINVLTTVNIQHLESLNDVVEHITTVTVRETIPDKIIEDADEVVVVDITPDALINRLKRGNIYRRENIQRSLKNFFRKGNLTALRELALRQTADEVDEDLESYMKQKGIEDNWKVVERVLVCISSSPNAIKLLRHGARIAKRYKCEFYVIDVECTHPMSRKLTDKDRNSIAAHKTLAEKLGAETISLKGRSISSEILKFCHERHITQLVLGHSRRSSIETFFRGSTINKILEDAKDIEIRIIPCDTIY
ncbi:two-component system, OmpR family, sensor histidine kinase KdpD [Clostridium cavendishii DSM 21758]|uniref:Two-component system, OmpR family, sensor histidine kinase KdpD n=1 Tax=Clostridium cavendishii DSM 21758 TaxID=1121302 RepID=A0A1M6QTD0_9CLOT|nr:universal stress protein [Clostridium cavendishii]SHK23466.1 two-component system, OmpR family, sensor histidine kinase KdpD [Clostridium cavendishii DSM 21758]